MSALYPPGINEKLGFHEIKELLSTQCLSPMGRKMVERMQFITNYDLLLKILSQTNEFRQILMEGGGFPADHYYDLGAMLEKIRVEGTWLSEEELLIISF